MKAEYWLQISSGSGPCECALAVAKLTDYLVSEFKRLSFSVDVLSAVPAEKSSTFLSTVLRVNAEGALPVLKTWCGTIQWVCQSPYRPRHKRKNWFVAVELLDPYEITVDMQEDDLRFDALRASGPGGQHVNKTSSAIRVTHVPTGLTALAQEERSQHRNKKLALARLYRMLVKQKEDQQNQAKRDSWERHANLQRGSAMRVFIGEKFHLKN